VKNLAEIRKTNMDEEAKMSARIAEVRLCDPTHDVTDKIGRHPLM
jgi:hypothetical protein